MVSITLGKIQLIETVHFWNMDVGRTMCVLLLYFELNRRHTRLNHLHYGKFHVKQFTLVNSNECCVAEGNAYDLRQYFTCSKCPHEDDVVSKMTKHILPSFFKGKHFTTNYIIFFDHICLSSLCNFLKNLQKQYWILFFIINIFSYWCSLIFGFKCKQFPKPRIPISITIYPKPHNYSSE